GDDPRWASPDLDDSTWETVDLTPVPGAHDDDVGLTGYVAGWAARGHRGHAGYAWYRLRLQVSIPAGWQIALAGPVAVDSAYQVFHDGQLRGGIGEFSTATPVVYAIQPRAFPLSPAPPPHPGDPVSICLAFRVWMDGGELATIPDAGGIHIAPAL